MTHALIPAPIRQPVTEHMAGTWTCDPDGNWRHEIRPLHRDANGWHDRPAISLTATIDVNERTKP
jgi:hypothetical protein